MELNEATILIGDDSILARKQLKDVIESAGSPTIVEANNGEVTVEKYKEAKPDLVFIDLVMPVKDGISAIKEITAFDPNAKIIVVSSIGTQQQLKEAIMAGAQDFLQKPFYEPQIIEILRHTFEGR